MRNTARASNRPGRTIVASALATALGLSLLGMAPASFAQPAATHQFAVASQPLGEALNRLAETAGVQIMVPPDLVRGHTAPALSGQYTVQQALDRLLAGTGLVHRSTRGGVITLARAPAPAAAPRPSPP
ncbi:MAG: TonB-dependent siderophore receptor, partial [Stenotrophomonas sp.]